MSNSQLNEIGIEKLAKELAINHFNISIAEQDIDTAGGRIPRNAHYIFTENLLKKDANKKLLVKKEDFCFTRNILIVGSGATTNTYEFIKTADGVIKEVEENIGLVKLFEHQTEDKKSYPFKNKYFQLAEELISRREGANNIKGLTNDELNKRLKFDDKLDLLSNFFTQEEINREIEKVLEYKVKEGTPYKYLPSLTYEIIAHLFKHRYIDIIINLNFDELLDNAIEDEMGEATYHNITEDSLDKSLERIIDHNRLRVPVYIKPHGTISKKGSLKYTNRQYISLSEDLISLLNDIFSGKVSKTLSIPRFNIILAGYSIGDSDIQTVLFNQLKSVEFSRLNYFIFDYAPDNVVKSLTNGFINFVNSQNAGEIRKYSWILKKKIHTKFECKGDDGLSEYQDSFCMGNQFLKLYSKIRSYYRLPFKPKYPVRHVLQSIIFPRNMIKKSSVLVKPEDFFKARAKLLALLEVIRYKGRIPINVIISDRVGKYQNLGLEEIRKDSRELIVKEKNIIGYLSSLYPEMTIGDSFLFIESLSSLELGKDSSNDVSKRLIGTMVALQEHTTRLNDIEEMKNSVTEVLSFDNIINSRANEINAIHNDNKHQLFNPFRHKYIINTNLELTWRFFKFFKVKKLFQQWTHLWMIDDTGRALYNLYDYSEQEQCYLENVRDKKKIHLLYNNKESEPYSYKENRVIKDIIDEVANKVGEVNFAHNTLSEDTHLHRMAIFLKSDDNVHFTPIFGIYFFQPSKRVKINPVYFSANEAKDQNTKENLKILCKIFKELSLKAPLNVEEKQKEMWDIIQQSKIVDET